MASSAGAAAMMRGFEGAGSQTCHGSTALLRCVNSLPKTSISSNASIRRFLLQKRVKLSTKSEASMAFFCQSPLIPAIYKQLRGSKAALNSQEEDWQEGIEMGGEDFPRESVSHVASASAIETPEKVHEEAEQEAQTIASEKGRSVEEISKNLEVDADQASQKEVEALVAPPLKESDAALSLQEVEEGMMTAAKGGIENTKAAMEGVISAGGKARDGYESVKEAMQPHIEAANQIMEGVKESGRNAGEIYGFMKEALDKRVQGLSQATEEAMDVGMKAVEMASKRWEDLMQQAKEVHGYIHEKSKAYQSSYQEDTDPMENAKDEDQSETSQKNERK